MEIGLLFCKKVDLADLDWRKVVVAQFAKCLRFLIELLKLTHLIQLEEVVVFP